ncbi:hypothetical protein CLF_110752 [Clonorchis sinensis]|uniref:Uncharacterized protein n=1 Tax=Clonorchis sinensis TaxID=79923 RepID=G7YTU5_CLOSI|nr:hypothetical protein CLF_110752 [Clonorchis sinensis]
MIFHPEFDSQRVFAPTTLGGMPTYIQKGINLSREERILWKRQERRRRKVQEVKAGVKRFMAMLFSHIGLSVLVVVYTIIGALIFVGLEQHKELATKDEARKVREETAKQLLHKLILKLDNWLVTYKMSSCNETSKLLRYLLTHSTPAVKSEEPKPRLNVTEPFFNTSNADNVNVTTTVAISMEPTSTALSHNPLYVNLAEALQYIIQEGFLNFTKNVVVLVTDQGWDGDDSKTELKWSIAGGVLYAVTVITTIEQWRNSPESTPTGGRQFRLRCMGLRLEWIENKIPASFPTFLDSIKHSDLGVMRLNARGKRQTRLLFELCDEFYCSPYVHQKSVGVLKIEQAAALAIIESVTDEMIQNCRPTRLG